MDSFDEYLGYFLTDCINNALDELRSNARYTEMKQKQTDIISKLEAIISPEARALLDEYSMSVDAINGLEFNRVMLCGLTTAAELRKRFDASTPEYKTFAEEYLT
jgi:hypothetical protein